MANLWDVRQSRVLVVDQDAGHVQRIRDILEAAGLGKVYGMSPARLTPGRVSAYNPDIIAVDPGPRGFDLIEAIQQGVGETELVPILVFTVSDEPEIRRAALQHGASDFLAKPGDRDEVLLRFRNFLNMRAMHVELQERNRSLEEKIARRTRALEESKIEILSRLAMASEWRDDDTGEHTKRVGELSARLANRLGWSDNDVFLIGVAAPLHDLGKIGIPDAILLSSQALTQEEFAIMKTHTTIGANILSGSRSSMLELAETIAMSHHERWDGRGYPTGLAGEDIPMCGRIVAVADVFDALTHDRPYKRAWPVEEAIAEITKGAGAHFDPSVVEAFLDVLGISAPMGEAAA